MRPAPGPRAADLTAAFVALFLEVEAGRRPRTHLRPLMSPMLYARLSDVWVRGGVQGTLVNVRVVARDASRCDAVAIVRRGARWGAIGVALVRQRGRWMVECVARAEDTALPPPPYPVPSDEPPEPDEDLPGVAMLQG